MRLAWKRTFSTSQRDCSRQVSGIQRSGRAFPGAVARRAGRGICACGRPAGKGADRGGGVGLATPAYGRELEGPGHQNRLDRRGRFIPRVARSSRSLAHAVDRASPSLLRCLMVLVSAKILLQRIPRRGDEKAVNVPRKRRDIPGPAAFPRSLPASQSQARSRLGLALE